MNFADRLVDALRRRGNPVLVGIDPMPELFPPPLLEGCSRDLEGIAGAIQAFGMGVLEAVGDLVPAVKFQAAYYEAYGPPGMLALRETAQRARDRGLIVLIDGKRNDIGSTAGAYARAYLGHPELVESEGSAWPCDAITINPYLGSDGIRPFLDEAEKSGKGVFLLVRTSNPSAVEFQDLLVDGAPLYERVAQRLAEWAEPHLGRFGYSSVGAVVGATYPNELERLRRMLPHVFFLIPGYGTQGGTGRDVAPAFDPQGLGAIINNSRGLIYAYRRDDLAGEFGNDWQGAVVAATRRMIADLAGTTSAANLQEPR
jgi:orotidine-5'-phosphate decarboxylase